MNLLNLGCGNTFHTDWINFDFHSNSKSVKQYDLSKGIPFQDLSADVVYHSHLLEHLSRTESHLFIEECYRVLKYSGIIRIAVPDLETIVLNYLKSLEGAINGDQLSAYNYEWILLEMYDQTVRNSRGGEMLKYLSQDVIPNEDFVFNRIGEEGKKIHDNYLKFTKRRNLDSEKFREISFKSEIVKIIQRLRIFFRNSQKSDALKIGRFRLSGEIHQWMYDRYSLGKLLKDCGFKNINVVTAFESMIPGWNDYQLDSVNGKVRKPDSLFIEAVK
jgi:predicted SAM-dependent methyltransferase